MSAVALRPGVWTGDGKAPPPPVPSTRPGQASFDDTLSRVAPPAPAAPPDTERPVVDPLKAKLLASSSIGLFDRPAPQAADTSPETAAPPVRRVAKPADPAADVAGITALVSAVPPVVPVVPALAPGQPGLPAPAAPAPTGPVAPSAVASEPSPDPKTMTPSPKLIPDGATVPAPRPASTSMAPTGAGPTVPAPPIATPPSPLQPAAPNVTSAQNVAVTPARSIDPASTPAASTGATLTASAAAVASPPSPPPSAVAPQPSPTAAASAREPAPDTDLAAASAVASSARSPTPSAVVPAPSAMGTTVAPSDATDAPAVAPAGPAIVPAASPLPAPVPAAAPSESAPSPEPKQAPSATALSAGSRTSLVAATKDAPATDPLASSDDGSGLAPTDADPVEAATAAPQPASTPQPTTAAGQQVLTALLALAGQTSQASGDGDAGHTGAADQAGTAPTVVSGRQAGALGTRAVTIALDPEHLGAVSIKIRMLADRVDIRIEVADTQTLALLDKDRHVLSAAVTGFAGRTDALALTGAPRAEADTAAGAPSTSSGFPSQQTPQRSASGQGHDQRAARQASLAPTGSPDDETLSPPTDAVRRPGGASVYV